MARPPFLNSPKVKFQCHRCCLDTIQELLHGHREYSKRESMRLLISNAGIPPILVDDQFKCIHSAIITVLEKQLSQDMGFFDLDRKIAALQLLYPKFHPYIWIVTQIYENDIVNELWQDHKDRRNIRIQLGKFRHAWEIKEQKDELMITPNLLPFTPEIDQALSPHVGILRQLLENPSAAPIDAVPAMSWLLQQKNDIICSVVPISGGISQDDQAAMNSWFDDKIPGAKQTLENLESRLFSQSEEAGIAGNQQWGLDHGPHYVYENGTIHEHQMKDPLKRSATEDPKDYSKPMPRPILKKRRRKIYFRLILSKFFEV
ncbi:hypothetical protein DFS33DRAFT_1276242 [Desarmillaria ectypa]|nr:hypothetical protein DFS33DRAFT_1276242 [Desarmillaria ectypa]